MKQYMIKVQCKEGELDRILARFEAAKLELKECMWELGQMGALVFEEATATDGDGKDVNQ